MLSKNILKKVKNLGDKISIILPDDLKKEIDKLREHAQEDRYCELYPCSKACYF